MKVPLSWLQELVDLTLTLEELVHRLNMSGTEVENVIQVGADWEEVYVARVVELDRHPDADALYVARVDVGSQGLATVVTGAANLSVGARVPLVRPGGRLPGGREIESETLRGVLSEGMLCSGDELGLSPDRSGIYVLDGAEGELHVGRPLRDVLADTVLDLYITPNRPDCMSVYGIAREVHAITGAPLRPIKTVRPRGERPASELIRVEVVDSDLCSRFTAAYVADVTVGPSPLWLQRRLHLAGVRPISNVVDATNYTMLELGQPQHAFDADRLGDQIVVRRAGAQERLRTLDGVDRALDGEMLVIADGMNPVGIAGVMGGERTEVGEATRNVVLETANFAPRVIRRMARELRLPSEASRRFERGLSPELAMVAAQRTVGLLTDLAGGTAADGVVDAYPGRSEPRQLLVHEDQIANLLGRPYGHAQIGEVLESLEFAVEPRGERLLVTVPAHRLDVEGRADLAEEVARITGYDSLPEALPTGALPEPKVDPLRAVGELAKDVLVGCGLREVMTYSLVSPTSVSRLLGPEGVSGGAVDDVAPIPVANAISAEQSVLRTTLLPSLLETARLNLRHRDGVAIFELARVYLPPLDPLPREELRLGVLLTGPFGPPAWNAPARQADFFDLKGIVEELLARLGLTGRFSAAGAPPYHPGRCAELRVGAGDPAAPIGSLGQIHPGAAERFDLAGHEVYAAELRFNVLAARAAGQPQIRSVPRLPGLDRDLAFVVDRSTPHAEVEAALRSAGGALLESVRLFDLYDGPRVPSNKKSLAYTVRFRAPDRTLTDQEADAAVARVVEAICAGFGARLRSGE